MTIRTEQELLDAIDQPGSNVSLGKSTIDRQVLRDLVESIGTIAGSAAYTMIRDEKTTGTNGGTYTAGAFQTRDLQTVPVDEIGITLAANRFTLPAGTYRIDANAPAEGVQNHCARLQNITDGVTTLDGSSELSLTASPNRSFIMGQFVIAAPKDFEIQHRGAITVANTGMGRQCAFGAIEVYTIVELLKVA